MSAPLLLNTKTVALVSDYQINLYSNSEVGLTSVFVITIIKLKLDRLQYLCKTIQQTNRSTDKT